MGYAGGTKKDPTYHDLGDHSETIEIDYDPTKISYEELLEVFWQIHDPTQRAWSRQYMTAIFYHGEAQKKLAFETRERVQARLSSPMATQILPATEFSLAEAYHQKHRLRQDPDLMGEFARIYANNDAFVDSTAAARINGYLYGYGTVDDVDRFGLSEKASRKLVEMVRHGQSGSSFLDLLRARP